MAAINYLTLRSTLYYTAPGSLAAPSSIFTVASDGQAKYASTIAVKGLSVASTSVGLGTSTNLSYSNLSNGSYTSTSWTTSLTGLASTNKLVMTQNGATQYVLQQQASTLTTTNNTGLNWSTLSTLPTGPKVSYPALSASATGQYIVAPMAGGQVYTSANYGQSFSTLGAPTIYLPFEGSAVDTMGNVSTTVIGAPTYVNTCAVGTQAIYFNNTVGSAGTQFVNIPWTGVGATSFTISFWIYPTTINGTQQDILTNTSGTCYFLINPANKLGWYIPNGGSTGSILVGTTSYALTANTWYQIAGVFTTNGTCSLYVNNQLAGSIVQTGGIGSIFSSFWLGSWQAVSPFAGYVDDFKIYTAAIQTPPIQATVYFPFDGNMIDYMGGVVTTTGTPTYVTDSSGTPIHAIFLNNTAGAVAGQYIRVPLAMGTQPNFTVSFVFQAQTLAAGNNFLMECGTASTESFYVYVGSTGLLTLGSQSGASTYQTQPTSQTITAGTWYAVRITYVYGGNCVTYVNNVQVGSFAVNFSHYAATTTLSLGCSVVTAATAAFNGYIDEFRLTVQPTIYLPMDGSLIDAMGISTVTATGPITYGTGIVGAQSLNLTNVDSSTATQYIRGALATTPANFTVSLWFNMRSFLATNGQEIVFSINGGALLIIIYSGSLAIYQGGTKISTPSIPATNTWYQVTYTHQNNSVCTMYLNGTQVGSYINSGGIGTSSGYFGIGTYDSNTNSPYNGYIDDFKFYNYVVPVTATTQPTIYLSFENASALYSDAMGNSTVTQLGSLPAVTGQVGSRALSFPNTPGATATYTLTITPSPALSTTTLTFSFWMNLQLLNGTQQDIFFNPQGTLGFFMNNSSQLSFFIPTASTQIVAATTSYALTVGLWYHVVGIFQANGACSLYVNGALIGSYSQTNGLGASTVSSFTLGAYLTSTPFKGYIDDFRIYNSVVSLSTVFAPVTAGLYVPTGAQIYLPFDSTIVDAFGGEVTAYGSPGFVTGVSGVAINLANSAGNTATQYVRAPITLSTSPTFTMSYWFNAQSVNANGLSYICSIGTISTDNAILLINGTPNLYFNILSTNYYIMPISTATWYYVVVSYTSTGSLNVYVNNTLMTSLTLSGLFSAAPTLITLGGPSTASQIYYAFNGYIDEFRFTNTALTQYPLTIPFACTQTAVSGTGQYMLAASVMGGLFQSSNYGASWSQVLTTLTTNPWNSVTMSASGQNMLTMGGGMTTPNLSGLAAYTWWQNGVQWTASASSQIDSTFSPYLAFKNNYTSGNSWASPTTPVYALTTGTYGGVYSTTVLGGIGTISGEWLQIQSSIPLVMSQYSYAGGGGYFNLPKTYYIVGSTDGTNWYPIQYASMTTNPINTNASSCSTYITVNQNGTQTIQGNVLGSGTFTTYSTTTNAYTYFRIIGTTIYGTSSASYLEFGEFLPVFQAGESYSTNYGATWSPVATYGSDAFNIVKSATLTKSLSSYITMPTFAAAATGVTFSCWFSLPTAPSNFARILDFGASTGRGAVSADFGGYNLAFNSNALIGGIKTGIGLGSPAIMEYNITTSITFSTNTLYHVVWTVAPSGINTIYINGTLNISGQGILNTQSLSYCWLGKSNWAADPYIDLTIADFRMYNRAITATEVAALYATPYELTVANTPTPNLAGLASNTWGQNGVSWTASASSNYSGYSPYGLFNGDVSGWNSATLYNAFTGAYTGGSSSTTIQGGVGAIAGEYFQLQASVPLVMSTYTMACMGPTQFCKTYYIAGSNDGTTWYPVQYAVFSANPMSANYTRGTSNIIVNSTSAQTFIGSTSQTLTTTAYATSATPYTYFRFICTNVFGSSGGSNAPNTVEFGIYEFYPIFTNPTPYVAPTTSLANVVQPQQSGLAAATWTQAGVNWTASSSTNNGALYAYNLFDNNYNQTFNFSSLTYNQSGNTSGTFTTIQTIGSVQGDWIQLQSTIPLVISSYQVGTGNAGGGHLFKKFYIIGSNDASAWYPIQQGNIVASPNTAAFTLVPNVVVVNYSGSQTFANTTITTTTYAYTTTSYTYFRFVFLSSWSPTGYVLFSELPLNFANPAPLNTSLNPYTFQAVSGNGQYALDGYGPQAWLTTTTVAGLSSNAATLLTLPGINANINCASISATGQYMTIMSQGTTNNVFYSTNYGQTWTALTIGSSPMTGCAISADGSYISVSNATTVYTLNLNSQGYTTAIGNQAGQTNQGANAIAIGNQAGTTNQSANSIVLNATGAALNAYVPGFFVGPVASTANSMVSSVSILGYGADSQVTQVPGLYATAGGYVGIGTTNPAYTLDVSGTAQINSSIGVPTITTAGSFPSQIVARSVNSWTKMAQYYTAGLYTYGAIQSSDYYSNTEHPCSLVLQPLGGNVGIGTTMPNALLQIYGGSNNTRNTILYLKSQQAGIVLDSTVGAGGGNWNIWAAAGAGDSNTGGLNIYDVTASAFRMVISSTGNVGIGTTNPYAKLYIYAGANNAHIRIADENNDGSSSTFYYPVASYYARQDGVIRTTTPLTDTNGASASIVFTDRPGTASWAANTRSSDMLFYTANSINDAGTVLGIYPKERMRITAGGNVGIGTTNPSTTLVVNGTVTASSFTSASGSVTVGTTATTIYTYYTSQSGFIAVSWGNGNQLYYFQWIGGTNSATVTQLTSNVNSGSLTLSINFGSGLINIQGVSDASRSIGYTVTRLT